MLRGSFTKPVAWATLALLLIGFSACTSPREYIRNGFKVGPSYGTPPAPLAKHWIDTNDPRLVQQRGDLSCWWSVFKDPVLNRLIANAYRQNLTLREAGFRVMQARALRGIAAGTLFPQQQNATGSYRRFATTENPGGERFGDSWNSNFNLSWELDFWGRFRRAVAAADDNLDASVAGYDQAIVTLLGDVAQYYVRIRTDQERIKLLRKNAELQESVFRYVENQLNAGAKSVTKVDYEQALSNLRQTQAAIPQLEADQRIAENRLCVLLGMPVIDLQNVIGTGPIPTVPAQIVINLPADLLRQRPDVRQAQSLAAAQGEAIGIAKADLYPAFSINGTLGYTARDLPDLFKYKSFNGSVGPSFQWNLLNYGRIMNSIRYEEARFQELVAAYQQTVLEADEEVEDGIITFLRAQEREKLLRESMEAAAKAVNIVVIQLEIGSVDINRYTVIQQSLVQQQDTHAQAVGQIAQGLIQVYRALGGGWEVRFSGLANQPLNPTPLPPTEPNPANPATPAIPEPNLTPTPATPEPTPATPAAPAIPTTPATNPAMPAPEPAPKKDTATPVVPMIPEVTEQPKSRDKT